VCLAKLQKLLKMKLLKLQFPAVIRLKYIKILYGRCLVMQSNLFDVIIYKIHTALTRYYNTEQIVLYH